MRAIVAIVVPATLIACQTGNARSTATLSVTVVGPGGVTSPLLAGLCRGTCAVPVSSSRSIRLEALADAGAGFAGWSGDCAGTASCDLTVSGTGAAVVATFEAPRLKLEVSLNGSGAVRSDPDGIDCPGTCSATFAPGASVRLTATAAANSEFGGFTGACSGASCSIVLSGPGSVHAVFKRRLVQVEVAVDGGGSVTSTPAGIDCPRACTASFPADSPVALTATPQEGFRFKEFAGACRGNACVVNPWFPPLQITAVFSAIPQGQLAVSLAGTGGGRVTSTPAGIDCPGKCTAPFYQGTQVKLTARPRALSRFAGWTGACVGTTCTLPIVFDTAVSGSFVPLRYALIDLGPQVASSRANGISAKGSFVVGLSSTSSGVFFWNGAMNDLGIPQDPPTDVAAVNEAGLAAGWHGVPARAFRWQSGKLTDLPSLGGGDSWVGGLNDSGVVVGSSRPPNSYSLHAVSWGPGGITDLGSLGTGGNACSVAEGINNAGVIVGYSCIDGPSFEYRAVRFRAPDVIDDLGTLGGDWASAMAVNDDGMIVGGSRTLASGVEHGFVHTDASGIVDIGVLPGMVSSYLLAVGPSGLALGESWDASGAGSAILYGEGRLVDLNDLVEGGPYAIEYARGVSDSGEIVATARFGSQLHAVLVVPR